MKKIYLFAIFLSLISCGGKSLKKNNKDVIDCNLEGEFVRRSVLGDGYEMRIEGDHKDLVKFYLQNRRIAEDNIRDGDCLNLLRDPVNPNSVSRISAGLHLGNVLFGTTRERGNFYCYALVGEKVYRSPSWSETLTGNEAYMYIEFQGTTGRIWHRTQLSRWSVVGSFTFDASTNIWTCDPGNVGVVKGQTVLLN